MRSVAENDHSDHRGERRNVQTESHRRDGPTWNLEISKINRKSTEKMKICRMGEWKNEIGEETNED